MAFRPPGPRYPPMPDYIPISPATSSSFLLNFNQRLHSGSVASPHHRPEARLSFHHPSSSSYFPSDSSWGSHHLEPEYCSRDMPPAYEPFGTRVHPHHDILTDSLERPQFGRKQKRNRSPGENLIDISKYGTKRTRVEEKTVEETQPSRKQNPASFFSKLLRPVVKKPEKVETSPKASRTANGITNGQSGVHYSRISRDNKQPKVTILSESSDPVISRLQAPTKKSLIDSDSEDEIAVLQPSHAPVKENGVKNGFFAHYNLPKLTSTAEKDILGGIFSDWEREKVEKSGTKPLELVPHGNDSLQVHMSGFPPVRPAVPAVLKPSSAKSSSASSAKLSSEYLHLDSIMAALPDNGRWDVSRQDEMRGKGFYLQTKDSRKRANICSRCGERTSSKNHICSQSICAICHSYDHLHFSCPFKTTVSTLTCKRCRSTGHLDIVCSEIWRQYHTTIYPNTDVIRRPHSRRNVPCSNCAGVGHASHECRRRRFNKTATYSPNLLIQRYDSLAEISRHRQQWSKEVEKPIEKFARLVSDMMSDEDSELMTATYDHMKASRKRFRNGSSPFGSPNKWKRMNR